MNKRFSLNTPWYVLLVSAYPVLYLLSVNYEQLDLTLGIRPLLVFTSAGMILFFTLRKFLGDSHRAAFLTMLSVLFFSGYGHVYSVINRKWTIPNLVYFLTSAWLVVWGIAFWAALRKKFNPSSLTPAINIASVMLLVMPINQLGYFTLVQRIPVASQSETKNITVSLPESTPPDVYYIILDSYGREDLLQEAYGFDNSEFTNTLKDLGFYVAECSQSNYPRTELSLSSALNMDYLQSINPIFTSDSTDRTYLWKMLKNNAVSARFEELGYTTVAYATGFYWSEMHSADEFFAPSNFSLEPVEFEGMLIQTTLLRAAQETHWINFDFIKADRYRERTRLVIDSLSSVSKEPGPKFVFAHIISPHPPFVFGPGGEHLDPDDYRDDNYNYTAEQYARGYQLQVQFINEEIENVVKNILENAETPPIIIIQGDHGPWLQPKGEVFKILNAYYLPGHQDILYPSVSPVNTFRMIFNTYFSANFPLLEDRSYHSPIPHMYEFSEAPKTCPEK